MMENCSIKISGECTKDLFYKILEYVDDVKGRGFRFIKHDRKDLDNGNIRIDYYLQLGEADDMKITSAEAFDRAIRNTYGLPKDSYPTKSRVSSLDFVNDKVYEYDPEKGLPNDFPEKFTSVLNGDDDLERVCAFDGGDEPCADCPRSMMMLHRCGILQAIAIES